MSKLLTTLTTVALLVLLGSKTASSFNVAANTAHLQRWTSKVVTARQLQHNSESEQQRQQVYRRRTFSFGNMLRKKGGKQEKEGLLMVPSGNDQNDVASHQTLRRNRSVS
jgi:flagellar basal body rod protein FlgC